MTSSTSADPARATPTPATPPTAWHAISREAVLARLQTSPAGLSTAEASMRLAHGGPNALREAVPLRVLPILLAQFQNLLVGLLLVAGAVAWLSGEMVDAIAILAIVVLNAAIGFAQELHAERALAALRRLTAPRARVQRDGTARMIAARDVVVGDIIELEAGDLVPADGRLLEAFSLQTLEASLTGESMPTAKDASLVPAAATALADRGNMVFSGTSVAAGRASAVVVATGGATELGQIGELLRAAPAPERTPLQGNLAAFARTLVWGTLGIVVLMFCVGLAGGVPLFELFLSSVALAVAAVPEGLPAVVTIALAVGVRRMAKRRALVRRLHAVETLGCTDVICADKTGTLTFGEMAVRSLWVAGRRYTVTGDGYGPHGEVCPEAAGGDRDLTAARELLWALVACNGARIVRQAERYDVVGDPTEGALLAAGTKLGLSLEAIDRDHPRLFEIPFDNERKRMTIVRARGNERRAYVKGAPEVLIERCAQVWSGTGTQPFGASEREAVRGEVERMSARALRVLLAAYRDVDGGEEAEDHIERDLVLLGLVGMQDSPRPQARAAIERCRGAGVRVAMITGDHPRTAVAVARELGIVSPGDETVSGPQLEAIPTAELAETVERVGVFARVTAAHKLQIVHALRARGHVVAMTGDGVNDAPAVRSADIGIAMGMTGTEVTKAAADMVITDDDFATIVRAIEQGRGIYANIKKSLLYLLATNCAELMAMAGTLVLGLPLPLLPLQILWINLVTDGLPALCLATDPVDPAVMHAPPRGRGEKLADRRFLVHVLVSGAVTAATVVTVFVVSLRWYDLAFARAHAFSVMVAIQLLLAFTFRSPTQTLFEVGVATNLRLLLVVVASLALQLAAPYLPALSALLDLPPMPLTHTLALILVALLPVSLAELAKLVRRARGGSAGP